MLFFVTPLFGVVLSNLLLDEPLGLELISGAVLVAAENLSRQSYEGVRQGITLAAPLRPYFEL